MLWYLAMVGALPLLLWANKPRSLWSPKARSWLVVMGASLATYLHQSVPFYLIICLAGAVLVMAYPMTSWQRFLGWTFLAMAGFNLGYLVADMAGVQNSSSVVVRIGSLSSLQHALGWAMVATLYAWGGHDGFRHYWLDAGFRDDGLPDGLEHEA